MMSDITMCQDSVFTPWHGCDASNRQIAKTAHRSIESMQTHTFFFIGMYFVLY